MNIKPKITVTKYTTQAEYEIRAEHNSQEVRIRMIVPTGYKAWTCYTLIFNNDAEIIESRKDTIITDMSPRKELYRRLQAEITRM